jgi:hypothetical protein
LNHELLDDTVECRPLISKAFLAGGKSTEVLSRLRDGLAIETQDDSAQRLVALGDVKVNLVSNLGAFGCGRSRREEDGAHGDQEGGGDEEFPDVEHGDDG